MKSVLLSIVFLLINSFISAQQFNPFELRDSAVVISVPTEMDTFSIADTTDLEFEITEESSMQSGTGAGGEVDQSTTEVAITLQNPFELRDGADDVISEEKVSIPPVVDSLSQQTIADSSLIRTTEDPQGVTQTHAKAPTIPVPTGSKNLLTFVISLISGLLLSIVFTSKRIILSEINKSLRNMNYMKLFLKNERNGFSVPFVLLMAIYVLNISVFIRFVSIHFEVGFLRYNFWLILALVIVLLVLRHLSLNFLSYLRKRLPDALQYSFIIMMTNTIIGLVLIPINLLIAYGPESITTRALYLGLIMVAFLWLLKWLRGFLNSIRIIIGDSFHFLLYLCACEIAPILICIGYLRSLIY